MKKLFIILFTVIIIDVCLIGLYNVCDVFFEIEYLEMARSERGELIEDKELTQRGRELENIFKCSDFPIQEEIIYYVFIPTDETEKYAGTTYGNIIVINEKFKENEGVLLHELCHASLNEREINTENHDAPEWYYLHNFIKNLGYIIY